MADRQNLRQNTKRSTERLYDGTSLFCALYQERMDSGKSLQVEKQKENYLLMDTAFFELKMPCDTVTAADFADSECEASAKSVAVCTTREQQQQSRKSCIV